MNLENPKKFKMLVDQAHEVALNYFRPISRKYDKAEHAYPKELDMLASLLDGFNDGSAEGTSSTALGKRGASDDKSIKNGTNMSAALG
ncbi:MAG: acyl-CoA dehydrogenase, partial [Perlucidibaca sp.]